LSHKTTGFSFLFGLHSPVLIAAFTASTKRDSRMQLCGGWVW
jgi:hypothetical protein